MQMSTELSDKSFIFETKCNRLKTANSLLSGTVGIGWGGLNMTYDLAGYCSQLKNLLSFVDCNFGTVRWI